MGELFVTTFACVAVAAGARIAWTLVLDGRNLARHWDVCCEIQPPISVEEFSQLSDAAVNRDVALQLRSMICDCTGIDYDRIYPNTQLIQDVW